MEIQKIRHNWPEAPGFSLKRPQGAEEYVLLHFHNPVWIRFDGREAVTLAGALIVFAPGTAHAFESAAPLLHDWMHLAGPVKEAMGRFGLAPDTLYQPTCGPRVTELTALLEAEFFARRGHWQALAEVKLQELWIMLSRDLGGEAPQPVSRKTADRLRALRAEMLLHPEKPWRNEAMARAINLSVSRLYPLYRRMFSISPGRDLILMRVEKAKNMLRQGDSVSEVAERMGYASTYHFIRQFRQVAGTTPGRYGAIKKPHVF